MEDLSGKRSDPGLYSFSLDLVLEHPRTPNGEGRSLCLQNHLRTEGIRFSLLTPLVWSVHLHPTPEKLWDLINDGQIFQVFSSISFDKPNLTATVVR